MTATKLIFLQNYRICQTEGCCTDLSNYNIFKSDIDKTLYRGRCHITSIIGTDLKNI